MNAVATARWFIATATIIATAAFFANTAAIAEERKAVIVFAAASTAVALPELERAFETRDADIDIKVSYASTSALARQIAAGAPAHIFISANRDWARYLQQRNLIAGDSLKGMARGALVLVTSRDRILPQIDLTDAGSLTTALGDGWLAMANPQAVPAGIYARQALTELGLWQKLKPRVAATADVRAALLLAERDEARLAVVYATDARSSPKVRTVATIPAALHDPVDYMIATVRGRDHEAADAVRAFFLSEAAAGILQEAGFRPIPSQNETGASPDETARLD